MQVNCVNCDTKFDDDTTDTCPTCGTASGAVHCNDCDGYYDPAIYGDDCPYCNS